MKKAFLFPTVLIVALVCAFVSIRKQNINLVFIGDSITHGTMAKDQSPPNYAAEFLRQAKKSGTVKMSNQGISGYTTVDFLPSLKKAYPKVKAAADEFYKDKDAVLVFSVMLGTNDSAIKGPTGAPVSAAVYRANLKLIADSLLAAYPACKIVFNYPIWYSDNTHNRGAAYMKEGQLRVRSYWPQIDTLVNSFKRTHSRRVYCGDKKAYKYFQKNYLTDFKAENGLDGVFYLHPNKKGDMALGKFWANAIRASLK